MANELILRALITIDRRNGVPHPPIIRQVSDILRLSPTRFCREPSWIVIFLGEEGVDAGGPSRKLYDEVVRSIFEPDSRLMLRVSNNKFVPDPASTNKNDFRAIGNFLIICIRTFNPGRSRSRVGLEVPGRSTDRRI
jgi:hypothetical protein